MASLKEPTESEKNECLHKFYYNGDFVAQSVINILGTTAYEDFGKSLSNSLSFTGTLNNRFVDIVKGICKDKAFKGDSYKARSERLSNYKIGSDFERMCSKLLE